MRKIITSIVVLFLVLLSVNAYAEYYAFGFSSFTATNNLTINGSPFYNIDSGWINSNGVHQAGNTNYYSGRFDCGGTLTCKDFFSFDFSSLTGPVTSASFTVFTYGVSVVGTYNIYGTNLDPSDVNSANGYTSVPFYNRLTAGPVIGTIVLTPGLSYTDVTLTLNHQGLSWISRQEGEEAVVGGAFSAIPEPGTLILLGSGLVSLGGILRRKLLI